MFIYLSFLGAFDRYWWDIKILKGINFRTPRSNNTHCKSLISLILSNILDWWNWKENSPFKAIAWKSSWIWINFKEKYSLCRTWFLLDIFKFLIYTKRNVFSSIIYQKGFPQTMTLDELYVFFEKYGKVLQIFMRRFPATRQFKVKETWWKFWIHFYIQIIL